MADIGDVVELTVNIPERGLQAGRQGTVVHLHKNKAYEVEFVDTEGETLDFIALRPEQFIIVWRAETEEWVSVVDQATALIAHLPDEAVQEVLDFVRSLSIQSGKKHRRKMVS